MIKNVLMWDVTIQHVQINNSCTLSNFPPTAELGITISRRKKKKLQKMPMIVISN